VFLLPGALRDRGAAIATGLLGSFTLGVGQFCTKPGLVFALRGADTDAFLQTLASGVQGAACATMLTPGIRTAFEENRNKVTALAGVTVLAAASAAPSAQKTEGQPSVAVTTAANFLKHPELATEAFGPFTLVVTGESAAELAACARALEGQLTATVHGNAEDLAGAASLVALLEQKAGRLVIDAFPTGVEVSPAMNHGGPSPAASDTRFTSVGTAAMLRFAQADLLSGLPRLCCRWRPGCESARADAGSSTGAGPRRRFEAMRASLLLGCVLPLGALAAEPARAPEVLVATVCATCHGPTLTGGSGPNLPGRPLESRRRRRGSAHEHSRRLAGDGDAGVSRRADFRRTARRSWPICGSRAASMRRVGSRRRLRRRPSRSRVSYTRFAWKRGSMASIRRGGWLFCPMAVYS